jgi:predicted dehydrogenase
VGIIGLDTSHVTAFTQLMNDPAKNYGCKVVAGFPGGSPDIESSIGRVKGYTETLQKKFGVEIVDSIEELCRKVDGVLLESVDGRPHLAQVRPVIAANKPVFIDKPMAGSLADGLEIFRLAKENNVPCWSSSSLRFGPGTVALRSSKDVGKIMGCDAFSPCHLEEHHIDLYWYGIHGVEMLFTLMGPGCQTVQRAQTKDYDLVVGVWNDGRIGTFRGLRAPKEDYGTLVFGSKGIVKGPGYEGYGPLVEEIVKFFKTGTIPVPPEETLEILAFMTAADESKAKNGAKVELATVMAEARKQNAARK